MKIQPVEGFVFEGIRKRASQVFGCPCVYATANDKTKALEKMFSGRPVEYPYIFIGIETISHNNESYNTNRLARRGVQVVVGEDQMATVRLLPANFECQLEFYTNQFTGVDQGSVISFIRRWLFARRAGYLKFNIRYGSTELRVGTTLSESLSVPKLENKVEQEAVYPITATLTIHGYVSEPELGTQGVVNTVEVDVVLDANGAVAGSEFFSFNRE